MAVADTRIEISLIDNFSNGIKKAASNYESFSSSLGRGTQGQGLLSSASRQASKSLDEQANSLKNVDALMNRVAYSAARYLVVYKGFKAMGTVWDQTVVAGYEYNKMLETNAVGMAGILTSMTTLHGRQLQWNEAMSMSQRIMQRLSNEALRTSATTEELVETFRGLLGPGIGAGMSVDQIIKLTTVGVNAVKALGLPKNQLLQELRGMVQGGIKPASSTLATALGLTDKDIKEAKASSEGLYNFLMERLQGFNMATGETANTMNGRIARLKEGITRISGEAGKPLYDAVSAEIGKIADSLIKVETTTDETGKKLTKLTVNEDLKKDFSTLADEALTLGNEIGKVANQLAPAGKMLGSAAFTGLDFVVKNFSTLVYILAAYKGSKLAADLINIARDSNNSYEATTKLGRKIQELTTGFTGYAAMVKRAGEFNNALAANLNTFTTVPVNEQLEATKKKWQELGVSIEQVNKWMAMIKVNANSSAALGAEYLKYYDNKAYQTAYDNEYAALQRKSEASLMSAPKEVLGNRREQKSEYLDIANSKRAEESVTRLAEKLQNLGYTAEQAAAAQNKAQQLIINGNNKAAETFIRNAEKEAQAQGMKNEAIAQTLNQFKAEVSGVDAAAKRYERLTAQISKAEQAQEAYNKKLEKAGIKAVGTNYTNYAAQIKQNMESMLAMGVDDSTVLKLTRMQNTALRSGDLGTLDNLSQQIEKYSKQLELVKQTNYEQQILTNSTKDYVAIDYSKLTADQEKLLAFDQERILNLSTQTEKVKEVRDAYTSIQSAVREGTLTEQEGHQLTIELQKQVATGYVDIAAEIGKTITKAHEASTLNSQTATEAVNKLREQKEAVGQVELATDKAARAEQLRQAEVVATSAVTKNCNKEEIESYNRIVAEIKAIIAALQKQGISTEAIESTYLSYLNKVTTAQGEVRAQIDKSTEAIIEQNKHLLTSGKNAGMSAAKFIRLGTDVAFAASMFVDLTGEQDSWIGSAANTALQVGMLSDVLMSLVDKLKLTAEWASIARSALLLLPVAAAGGKYLADKYEKLTPADQADAFANYNNLMSPTEAESLDIAQKPTNYVPEKPAETTAEEQKDKAMAEYDKMSKDMDDKMNELEQKYSKLTDDSDKSSKKSASQLAAAQKKAEAEMQKLQAAMEKLQAASGSLVYETAEAAAKAGTEFGKNGCTAFVSYALGNNKLKSLFEGAGMAVPTAWARAQKQGLAVQSSTAEGAKAGDILFYGSSESPSGMHVGIYDGNGGVIHNSTSAGYRAHHQYGSIGMGPDYWLMGYVPAGAGATLDSGNTDYETVNAQYKTLKQKQKAIEDLISIYGDIDKKIMSNTDVPDAVKMAKDFETEINNYREKIAKDSTAGAPTEFVTEMLNKLEDVYTTKVQEQQRKDISSNMQDSLTHLQNLYNSQQINQTDYHQQYAEQLKEYKDFLRQELESDKLTKDERKRMESELTDVIKQEQENRAGDLRGALENELTLLSQYETDYQSIFDSVTSSFSSGIGGLMDGVITGQKTFEENIKESWQEICNSVINAIWKMAMEMYVVKPLFNWLGGMFGMGTTISVGTGFSGWEGIGSLSGFSNIASIGVSAHANGGVASGWSIVGERGPELVNFTQPSRVYTADQTAQALNGGLNNVKVEIVNQSGTEMKASEAKVSFDGEAYIINVVMDAVSTNKNGIRNILKGAVTT